MHFDFKHWLFQALLHPAFLALPIAAVIILLLPDIFSKYSATLIKEIQLSEKESRAYFDLDHDGYSEMLAAAPSEVGGSGIALYSYGFAARDHWIFEGDFLNSSPFCMAGDYDNNGSDEVYAFTRKNDSVLLNAFHPDKYPAFIAHNRNITLLKAFNGVYQAQLDPVTITDVTGDGYNEVIFGLYSGWAGEPRRIFAYDVEHDSLFSSPELGGHGQVTDIADIDGDGKMEFAITNYASGNILDTSRLMHDFSAYVLVLDHNMQFQFPPIANPGKYNSVTNYFLLQDGQYRIVSLWTNLLNVKGRKPLKLFDIKGHLVQEKIIEKKDETSAMPFIRLKQNNNKINFVLIRPNEGSAIYDENFKPRRNVQPNLVNYDIYQYDLDHDGEKELMFRSKQINKWILMRSNLKYPLEIELPEMKGIGQFYTILNGKEKPYFCINSSDQKLCIMQYGFNKNYYWRYPVYVGIYLLVFIFLALAVDLQKKQLRDKLDTQRRITEMQLSAIHSQMDSHFTFNVINTIGSSILQEKKDTAYDLLTRFSKLLRTTLSDSEKVTRSLEDEIGFVRNFLQIQKSRFKEAFEFEISEDPDIDPEQIVPKGCIQTYAENAIKHGLNTLETGGKLIIKIQKVENQIEISIRDNGVGRRQAALNDKTSTGRGLGLMHQYYEILNRNNQEKINETITDLYDETGYPKGTEVMITIPEHFDFGANP